MEIDSRGYGLDPTLSAGLMAGVFFTYSNSVPPGLAATEDRSFVDAMQRMNVAILNGWFLLCFLGTLVVSALALVLHLGAGHRAPLPWIAAGPPASIGDLHAVRAAFESSWVTWNLVRTAASIAAFTALARALVA